MRVSGQQAQQDAGGNSKGEHGPRARMRKLMLDAAMKLMQEGWIPSISDVAQEAKVSRATAYRYFRSQSALIHAAVDEALGPILAWESETQDPQARMSELLAFTYPLLDSHEATLKAALRLALDQWARKHTGTLGAEVPMVRGRRIGLLRAAMAPLRGQLPRSDFDRLTQSLSVLFGTEALVVLKDIWGLDQRQAQRVALWACTALVRAACAEGADKAAPAPGRRSGRRKES